MLIRCLYSGATNEDDISIACGAFPNMYGRIPGNISD